MASECVASPTTACGDYGRCVNGSALPAWNEQWICECDYPWVNIGDLSVEPTRKCEIFSPGVRILWGLCAASWFVVLMCALITAYRLKYAAPDTLRRRSETSLLTMKVLHASMFMVVAFLEISSHERVIGKDLTTTVCYAVASTLFWIEYKLFLVVPTLSSVTAIARAIAPKPMEMYTKAAPLVIAFSIVANFIVLGMVFSVDKDQNETYAIAHIEMSAMGSFLMLGSSALAMTAILRKFKEMLTSSNRAQQSANRSPDGSLTSSNLAGVGNPTSTDSNHQRNKIENVEEQIRQLRFETLLLFFTWVPGLVIFGIIRELRDWSPYMVPVAWIFTGLITLRFIYMSHQTVGIHLRRNRTDGSQSRQVNNLNPGDARRVIASGNDDDGTLTAKESTDQSEGGGYTPFSSLDSARHAISSLAKRRKKRRPKFVNAMTKVEEERTTAMMSRMDPEPYSSMNTTKETSREQPGSI